MGHHTPQHKPQQLRIIGGQWRGRKLSFPSLPTLRPTPDRVRETLFNWLQSNIVNSRCLDLFAGSGALGLEALSRGAASVVMVETDQQAINALHEHFQRLSVSNSKIIHADALAFLRREPEQPFDIVFLDPPFKQNLLQPCIELLEQQHWLTDDACVYIEADKTITDLPIPLNWHLHRSKIAGQVGYHLAIRHSPCDDPEAS